MRQPDQEPISRSDFEHLVEEYADRVYNIALHITGSPEDAEDAMQEVFLAAYRGWERFRGEASVSTWLYRITVNASFMRMRERKHPVEYLSDTGYDELDVPSPPATPADITLHRELVEKIEEGLSRLPPEYRATIVLRDVQGLSTSEAARVLEVSEANLKSRLHRARVLLRRYLQEYLRST